MIPEVAEHLFRYVDGLEFQGTRVLDVSGLSEDLENGGSEADNGGIAPLGHFGIAGSAIIDVVLPVWGFDLNFPSSLLSSSRSEDA